MSDKPSPAADRASKILSELLSADNDYRVGVVVLSYRRPGAGERDVSFAHATGMRTLDGALDFVLLAKALRQIADQLDACVNDPSLLVEPSTCSASPLVSPAASPPCPPGGPLRVGEHVRITFAERVVDGVVSLASENGYALLLSFDALLGGYLGEMPVSWYPETGDYRALIDQGPVGLERVLT